MMRIVTLIATVVVLSGCADESCEDSSECGEEEYCDVRYWEHAGTCRPLGAEGDECSHDEECREGLRCDVGLYERRGECRAGCDSEGTSAANAPILGVLALLGVRGRSARTGPR